MECSPSFQYLLHAHPRLVLGPPRLNREYPLASSLAVVGTGSWMFPGWEWGSGGLHWSAGAAVTGQHGLRGSESTRSVSQPGGWKSAVRVRAGLAPEAVWETVPAAPCGVCWWSWRPSWQVCHPGCLLLVRPPPRVCLYVTPYSSTASLDDWSHLQRPYVQTRSHSKVLGVLTPTWEF